MILCVLVLLLFAAILEFYAHSRTGTTIDVGKQTYTVFIIALFIANFLVPRHAVESLHAEQYSRHLFRSAENSSANGLLIRLTPITDGKILAGKLSAVVVWTLWGIWLAMPLLALSSYIGGFALVQLLKCGTVLVVSCIFFAIIGTAFALWQASAPAKGYSYLVILLVTFLPLIPFASFELSAMLEVISPLCTLFSVLHSGPTQLWIWHVALLAVLSSLIFLICVRRLGRNSMNPFA